MSTGMTESQLIRHLALRIGVSPRLIECLLRELVRTAIRETKENDVFVVPGLGRLVKGYHKARLGRNSQTGVPIQISAKTVVKFRVAKSAKDAIAGRTKDAIAGRTKDAIAGRTLLFHLSKEMREGFVRKSKYAVIRIFYASDREAIRGRKLRYGPKRNPSGTLLFGTCDVSIPARHKRTKIERPSIWRFELREDPKKHFVIREITLKSKGTFYAELSQLVQHYAESEAFVFIHGFNVNFEDAVYRTAQIAWDLDFPGVPILYSWPSNGKLLDYSGDICNNDWTVEHLSTFLKEVSSKSNAKTVHLIAHSMGNRALSNALNLLGMHGKKHSRFNQVVLTAPDIDADTFRQIARAIRRTAHRVTLYASTRDRALALSKRINSSYPRAGDCSSGALVVPGIDTIDASAVDTDLVGHTYYRKESVLRDVFSLFRHGSPPDQRFGIRPVKVIPPYWRFVP